MAKHRRGDLTLIGDDGAMVDPHTLRPLAEAPEAPAPAATADAPPMPAPHATTAGPGRYRVSLRCPTPIAHRTLDVEARTEEEARQRFCEANNISGSSHDWSVERIA